MLFRSTAGVLDPRQLPPEATAVLGATKSERITTMISDLVAHSGDQDIIAVLKCGQVFKVVGRQGGIDSGEGIQAQIIKLIKDLQKEFHYTIVFITHDLGIVANVADRVAVLYAGQIIEIGKVEEIFYDPRHPYTWALLSSLPQLGHRGEELYSIKGTPPNLFQEIHGDAFAPRNPLALQIDHLEQPPYFDISPTHRARTWLLDPRAPKVEPPEVIRKLKQ